MREQRGEESQWNVTTYVHQRQEQRQNNEQGKGSEERGRDGGREETREGEGDREDRGKIERFQAKDSQNTATVQCLAASVFISASMIHCLSHLETHSCSLQV